jgi:histidinol-phosphatase (PHP family)
MQNFNYHTHTYRCGHADDNMMDEDFVKELINKGFKKIAFTDHAPNKDGIDDRRYMRMKYSEKDEYLNSIKSLKEKYKDVIKIETGFEVEYLPGQEKNLFELKNETDKLVLGQHYIYAKDNKTLKIFRHHDFSDEDLIRYANYIDMAMEKGIPDIIVHPDLYMLSRVTFGETESKVAHIICKSAEKHNIPLEINLTEAFLFLIGRKRKINYPSKEFWQIASNYNIKVLYGIDAHYKEQIRMYEECITEVNNLIGKEVIEKLQFIENVD